MDHRYRFPDLATREALIAQARVERNAELRRLFRRAAAALTRQASAIGNALAGAYLRERERTAAQAEHALAKWAQGR
jgi:hypothetical protein